MWAIHPGRDPNTGVEAQESRIELKIALGIHHRLCLARGVGYCPTQEGNIVKCSGLVIQAPRYNGKCGHPQAAI